MHRDPLRDGPRRRLRSAFARMTPEDAKQENTRRTQQELEEGQREALLLAGAAIAVASATSMLRRRPNPATGSLDPRQPEPVGMVVLDQLRPFSPSRRDACIHAGLSGLAGPRPTDAHFRSATAPSRSGSTWLAASSATARMTGPRHRPTCLEGWWPDEPARSVRPRRWWSSDSADRQRTTTSSNASTSSFTSSSVALPSRSRAKAGG